MRVGITYDLKEDYVSSGLSDEEAAEFDHPATIEAIESTLRDLGLETERIGNLNRLLDRLVNGQRWDLVFNIAEGLRGIGREAQVPALLDAFEIPYTFSDPLVLSLTLHKGMTKHVVRDLGIPTPDFYVVETEAHIGKITLPFPLFAKPVAEGTGKGIDTTSEIQTERDLTAVCRRLLNKYRQPVLVERFLPGREFTVGILGSGEEAEAVGVMEINLKESGPYSYWNKNHWEGIVGYSPVEGATAQEARNVSLAAWRGLGCRDGGRVDLRADEKGVLNFMEVNPLAGLRPDYSDLPIVCTMSGLTYRQLIERIMQSALKRVQNVVST
jgi:D-alanine-D-alanine ligase